MRVIENVHIEGLIYDELPYNRDVLDIVFFIMYGGVIPPIKLQKTGRGWKIKDGRHRIAACKLLGLKTISAKFHKPEKYFIHKKRDKKK